MPITDLAPSAKDFVPFCVADRFFFDSPARLVDDHSWFDACSRPSPLGWTRNGSGLNISMRPKDVALPEQGWKIHVSVTPPDASRVIDIVWDYCIDERIAFKFLRSRTAVTAVNSKYWPRSASGKVATLYPKDDGQFAATIESLGTALAGLTGPYILSDLRYGNGPLFARYGAFVPLWCVEEDGTPTPAIRDPDGGLRPDIRGGVFSIPDFITPPAVLLGDLRSDRGAMDGFPYSIDHALHFSNGGGVYLGRSERSGERVVLREARPHAGLDSDGRDAVARLLNEQAMLSRLRGLTCAPRLIECREVWEHYFLITRYVAGTTLLDQIIGRYPLVRLDQSVADLRKYTDWVERLGDRLRTAVMSIHDRGVGVGDLHPSNIIVGDDDEVTIVDFENACDLGLTAPSAMGAQGFSAPSGFSPVEADLHALDRIKLMSLLPLVPILDLDSSKVHTLRTAANRCMGIGHAWDGVLPTFASSTRQDTGSGENTHDHAGKLFETTHLDWPAIRTSIVRGIMATASPERSDRLFPGDPLQFTFGGATLAYGAAGVLFALAQTGEAIPDDFVHWMKEAALSGDGCAGLGLYDGLHGVALALEQVGARESAFEAIERATSLELPATVGLFGGRSGVALSLLHFGHLAGEAEWQSQGLRLAHELKQSVLSDVATPVPRPGLLHGATGPALLFLSVYEKTGDRSYLEAASRALRSDLRFGRMMDDGTFHILVGTRYLIYVDGGSAGIGLVLTRYIEADDNPELASILSGIEKGCRIPFVMQPGLFQGRSGMIALLTQSSHRPESNSEVTEQARRLAWHAISYRGNVAFPGRGLFRLSCDLATGSAGVLIALHSALGGAPLRLPFLGNGWWGGSYTSPYSTGP